MPALATADLHLSENSRDEYRFLLFPWLRETIRKHKVDLLLILGDLCENKNRHSDLLVNRIVNELRKTSALCPIVLLTGNHDIESDLQTPFFGFLGRIQGLTYVRTPTPGKNLPIPPLHRLGNTIFLPFTPQAEKDWAGLDFGAYDWIFAHQAFVGAQSGSYLIEKGVDPKIFPNRSRVVAGDIHVPQDMYVGAPYQIDFGDQYQGRVLLLDRKTKKSIPYHGPQKRLVELSSLDDLTIDGINEGDILKIRIPPDPNISWAELKEQLHLWYEKRKVTIWSIQPVGQQLKAHKVTAQKKNQSDEDLVRTFGRRRGLSEKLVKSGLYLMKEESNGTNH